LDNFHGNHLNRLGKQTICKACKVAVDADYLDAHRDENKERSKARYYAKPEERAKYKAEHADEIAAMKRAYRKAHPEETKKHKQESAKRHPESNKIRHKRNRIAHPEITRLRGRVDAMKRRVKTDMTKRADLLQMYEDQNERCAYCGQSIYWTVKHDIHVDHIKPLIKGGTNDLSNLCLACADCNLSKHDMELDEWMKVRGW
jgi:5-methylcytosine-specific restriction endonuclease McrA